MGLRGGATRPFGKIDLVFWGFGSVPASDEGAGYKPAGSRLGGQPGRNERPCPSSWKRGDLPFLAGGARDEPTVAATAFPAGS